MESRDGTHEAARARWIEVEEGERDEIDQNTTSDEEKMIVVFQASVSNDYLAACNFATWPAT
jgi:hypothetical protein